HHAVRVEAHHVPVAAAIAPAEVCDVSALALAAHAPVPVEDSPSEVGLATPARPRLLLVDPEVRIRAVAQNEQIARLERTRALERGAHRAEPREYALDRLVLHGHHHGRP